jgi:hypothetical protein
MCNGRLVRLSSAVTIELVCKKLLTRRVTMDCPKSMVANKRKWPLSIV